MSSVSKGELEDFGFVVTQWLRVLAKICEPEHFRGTIESLAIWGNESTEDYVSAWSYRIIEARGDSSAVVSWSPWRIQDHHQPYYAPTALHLAYGFMCGSYETVFRSHKCIMTKDPRVFWDRFEAYFDEKKPDLMERMQFISESIVHSEFQRIGVILYNELMCVRNHLTQSASAESDDCRQMTPQQLRQIFGCDQKTLLNKIEAGVEVTATKLHSKLYRVDVQSLPRDWQARLSIATKGR